MEALEERSLLSGNVLQTNLVSDLPGVAQVQDPNLVNPWGISESGSGAIWISDNNSGVSTLYSVPGANNTPVSINPLVVSIPTPGNPLGATGTPTGTVFNIDGGATGGFTVSGVDKNGNPITASTAFLFATEDGTLVGWNPAVNPKGFDPAKAGTYGIIAVDNSGNNFKKSNPAKQRGAVYKGLTIASGVTPIFASDPDTTTVLYAANFRSGKVEVYDTNFEPVKLRAGAFTDPKLPKGYAPFNVQVLGSKVYVTYALQDAAKHDDVGGKGHGFIDVFNLDGTPGLPNGTERLVSRGPLDSPWGLALAPSSFGALSGDLLVGNFKSGFVDVFNPTTGKSLGTLDDPNGQPINIDHLWALQVGNGGSGGDANTVYFTAGLDNETHGLFGSLSSVSASAGGTPLASGRPSSQEGPPAAQHGSAAIGGGMAAPSKGPSGQPALPAAPDARTSNNDLAPPREALVDQVFSSTAWEDQALAPSHSAQKEALAHGRTAKVVKGHSRGSAQDVQVSVLTHFAPGMSPNAVAATNTGDVVALVGPNLISVGPNGQQKQKIAATISGGPLGPIGVGYDRFHQLYVALPESTAPPPHGTILKISPNGKQATPVPGSEGMVAPDGFGLDSATGDLYVTDIFGNSIWRIPPGGSAQLFTSVATNPLLVLPDGVKVFNNAVFTSLEGGKILRIPINPDGSAGTAQVFAQVNDPGVFFDDMTLDDRTGDVYVSRLDTNELLQITPGGAITPIATHADGLLGAANMSLIHVGQSTVIYLANLDVDAAGSGQTGGAGPAILKITIT
jgi:uncharacterized protein (TIGR03118 family)